MAQIEDKLLESKQISLELLQTVKQQEVELETLK
jgi:hypothetical protein